MSTFITLIAYLLINTVLINFGIKAGWDHDPGMLGPFLIVIALNLISAVYSSGKSK